MSEAVPYLVGALLAFLAAIIRELSLRRWRAGKLHAETTVDEASAAQTITETVKGLLLVMRKDLTAAQETINDLRSQLDDRDRQITALLARIDDLETRLTAAEQEPR